MAYTITLTDDEYGALAAAERGQPIETLIHAALAERYTGASAGLQAPAPPDPLISYMLRMGHIHQAPTGAADTPVERTERQRLTGSAASPIRCTPTTQCNLPAHCK